MRGQDSTPVRHDLRSGPWAKVPREVLDRPLTRQQLRTFIALGLFANGRTRMASVSQERIAELLGVGRRQVRDLLAALERHGLILKLPRRTRTTPTVWLVAPFEDGVLEHAIGTPRTGGDGVPEHAVAMAHFRAGDGVPEHAVAMAHFRAGDGVPEHATNRRTEKNQKARAGALWGRAARATPSETPEEIENRRRRALAAKAQLLAEGGSA